MNRKYHSSLALRLTTMMHVARITLRLDCLLRHHILRWPIRACPGRLSQHRRELRLYPGRFREPAAIPSCGGSRHRGTYWKGPGMFVDVEHLLETLQEATDYECCNFLRGSGQRPHAPRK